MAFDVSKITTAVNDYLYSISDVNKILTERISSGSNDLSGIFQKYLTGALNNIDAGSLSTNDRQAIIDAMKVSDSMNLYGINGNSDSSTSQDLTSSLGSLSSLGLGTDTTGNSSLSLLLNALKLSDTTSSDAGSNSADKGTVTDVVKAADRSSNSDLNQAFAEASDISSKTTLQLEDEINGVFAGMDNLGEVILNKIASRDITGEVNRSAANLDIKSDIQRSIASHDRSDEISEYNSYNASRIASYKNGGGSTSVFGDFKL